MHVGNQGSVEAPVRIRMRHALRQNGARVEGVHPLVQVVKGRPICGLKAPALSHFCGNRCRAGLGDLWAVPFLGFIRINYTLENLDQILPIKGIPSCNDLIERDPKRVHVALDSCLATHQKFRGHPQRGPRSYSSALGESKVRHLGPKVGPNENVPCLEVAMNDGGVERFKKHHALNHICHHRNQCISFQNDRFVGQNIRQRPILHVLHHEHRFLV
mmetsp:Transcript_27624/g.70098  ORF Transcript_27624/g.70098 Transcript_27624/m.70098 type:complete len:216 (+) Transcript_27624:1109-1756(+)